MELLDYILHFGNVLSTVDHRRLLEICRGIEFPDYKAGYDNDESHYYDMNGYRSQILLSSPNEEIECDSLLLKDNSVVTGELYDLVHKAMMRVMPKIYKGYAEINPPNPPVFNKYSGYWLCKYPDTGYLSMHTDSDADAGSVTVSYNINEDYEGGEVVFWDKHAIDKHENSIHVFPSNFLYPHEIKPVTKGTRYSVIVWFSYQKGEQWLT